MRFRHLDAGGLTPGAQRRILRWALILGGVTFLLGLIGLLLDPAFQTRWTARSWPAVLTDLLFTGVGLLTLSQPTPVPTNPVFSLARATALLFALLAGYTVVSALLGTVVETLRLRLIQRRSRGSWLARRMRRVTTWSDPGGATRGHVVIIGLGWLGKQLVEDLRSEGRDARQRRRSGPRDVVAVEIDDDSPAILAARRRGAVVIEGDARDPLIHDEALLADAGEIFVVCGDDALNLDITWSVLRGLNGRGVLPDEGPRIYVHIGEPEFSQDLASRGVFKGDAYTRVSVFNLWENAARRLMIDPERGLGARYGPGEDEVPYYIVLGFGDMGRTVALEIARLAHFRSLRRPRLTLVDDFADPTIAAVRDAFLARHPRFTPPGMRLADPQWLAEPDRDCWSYRYATVSPVSENSVDYAVHAEFLDMPGRVVTPGIIDSLVSRMKAPGSPRPAIVVCFDDDRQSVRTAFRLERLISGLEDPTLPDVVPLFVRLHREQGLRAVVPTDDEDPRVRLIEFGSVQDAASYDVVAQPRLKQVAVGMGWAYDMATQEDASYEERVEAVQRLPGDWTKYEGWYESDPPWARLANLGAAAHSAIKLRELGYRLDLQDKEYEPGWMDRLIDGEEVDVLAAMEHNRWMAQKLIEGYAWEDYPAGYETMNGQEKRRVRKEMAGRWKRAALVPFEALTREDKEKDRIQVLALPMILKQARLRPRRLDASEELPSADRVEVSAPSVGQEDGA